MTSHGIRCQSVTLGNQKDVFGVRGSHWGLPDRKIGVEKIWLAEFRHEKTSKNDDHEINPGQLWVHPCVTRGLLEASLMPPVVPRELP